MIAHAEKYGTKIIFTRQVREAQYDRTSAEIQINPDLSEKNRILLCARELRRVWQHRQGVLVNPVTFHPDHAVLINRVQIADVTVSMIRIAWELYLAGETGAWERLEHSSMSDLARAFARESHVDFRRLNNGMAMSAVFEAWFLSERCQHEDRRLIQQMLADYQGCVFSSEQASKKISSELIAALGAVPYGKNYLAPYVATITGDALFTEVRDRSNANFLWFIKFERSFRETEHNLQQAENVREEKSGSSKNKKQLGNNEETAKIITLSPRQAERKLVRRASGTTQPSADIIALSGYTLE
jgi:hypothetical protein